MNLGLKRNTVELFDHEIDWIKNANETIIQLKDLFGDMAIDIQHIGSTSIKDIKAKPIIDIVVGINDFKNLDKIMEKLNKNSVFHRPNNDEFEYRLFVKGDMGKEVRTHHIHVVKYDGEKWNNQINFRDYLNNNIIEAKEYEKLKIKLLMENMGRTYYTKRKEEHIKKVFEKAKNWRNNMKNNAEIAVDLFNKGFNCAQAVLAAYCSEYGLLDDIAKKLSCGFGAGMGYNGEVCGAVTGALMLIGLKNGKYLETDNESKDKTYKLVKEFIANFKNEFGSINCTDLLKYDLSKEEELLKARSSGIFRELCPLFVKKSAELVEEILKI